MEKQMENKSENSEVENLRALIKKTDKENPNPEDLREMKKLLDQNSSLVTINELSEQAFERFIKMLSNSALMNELTKRQIAEKRESLSYQTATIIERMLIDQVILCQLRLNHLEMLYTGKLHDSHSAEHGIYWDKRLSSSQKRFMKACESLAKVRKLISDAEAKEAQARNLRSKSAKTANDLLRQLTKD